MFPKLYYKLTSLTQLNRDSHWLILGDTALTKITCTLGHVIKHGGKWRDRGWEKHCQFSFLFLLQQHEHEASS